MNLPKNWYKRWDNQQPGTLQWWTEYAIHKTTGYCNHRFIDRGWIKANKHCDIAWQCEYQHVTSKRLTSPPRKRN